MKKSIQAIVNIEFEPGFCTVCSHSAHSLQSVHLMTERHEVNLPRLALDKLRGLIASAPPALRKDPPFSCSESQREVAMLAIQTTIS
eukprot:971307-Amphidinium_carterae.1